MAANTMAYQPNSCMNDDLEEDCCAVVEPRVPQLHQTAEHFSKSGPLKGGQRHHDLGHDDKTLDSASAVSVDSGLGSIDSECLSTKVEQLSLNEPIKEELPFDYVEAIYSQDDEGDNQLMIAIIQLMSDVAIGMIGKATTVQLLDITNDLHQTAMHLCVIVKLPEVLKVLLERGASPNILDRYGNSPLHIACREGDEKSIGLLTRSLTQDINALNFEGLSCLHLAAMNNHARVMFYLIRKCGADINVKDGKSGRTVLHWASENNQERLVELLLNWEADIEAQTFDRSTPLCLAGGRSNHKIVQLLMNFGADPEALRSCSSEEEDDDEDEMDMADDIKIGGEPV